MPPQGGESAERLLKAATDAAPASLQPVLASVAARIKTKPADVDTDDDDDATESVAAEGWVLMISVVSLLGCGKQHVVSYSIKYALGMGSGPYIETKLADIDTDNDDATESVAAEGWVAACHSGAMPLSVLLQTHQSWRACCSI